MRNSFEKIRANAHFLIFALVAVAVFPVFGKGFFFLLDGPLVAAPDLGWHSFLTVNFYPFLALFAALDSVFPLWFVQRLAYLAAVFFLWISGYALFRESSVSENRNAYGAYAAWMLLVFNPYCYSRILSGQIGLAFSLAAVSFFVTFLIRHSRSGKTKDVLLAGASWAVSVMWAPHAVFFVFAILSVFALSGAFGFGGWKKRLAAFSACAAVILVPNANWIVGSFVGEGYVSNVVKRFDDEHFKIFATGTEGSNLYSDALELHGFWGERQGRMLSDASMNARWAYLYLIVFSVVLFGLLSRLRDPSNRDKRADVSILVVAVIAYVLSLGVSQDNAFAPVSRFLYDHLPFYAGLREPQKWSSVLLFAYAYFFWHGVSRVVSLNIVKNGYPRLVATSFALLPVLTTPVMLFALHGQIFAVDYPQDWYRIREELRAPSEGKKYSTLVLPWHQYLSFGFTHRIVANPAEGFFPKAGILQGDNMEFWEVYSQSFRPESAVVEKYVRPGWAFSDGMDEAEARDFAADMKGLGIGSILLLKAADSAAYAERLKKMEVFGLVVTVSDTDTLTLYEFR